MRQPLSITQERAIALGTVAAVALILILRKPDSLHNPQFFAEDGTIFFIGARQLGLEAFLIPYGGYLHLAPRAVAWAAAFFDPLWTPAIYNWAALCIDVLVIAALFSRRVRLPAKPALALAFALVPHTGEVFLSLTNIQWCLALGLVMLLTADDAATVAQRWSDRAAVLLIGLTGPFLCFLSPLFILRAAARRTRESAVLAVLAILAASVQVKYLYAYRSHFIHPEAAGPHGLSSIMAGRLYGTFWLGYGIPQISSGPLWIAAGVAATGIAGWFSLRRGEWLSARITLALAWLCFVIPVALKFRTDPLVISLPGNGDRYFFLPHVMLAWILVVACVQLRGWFRLIPALLLAAAIAANVPYLRAAPLIDFAWARHVQPVRDGDAFEIPINPAGLMLEGRALNSP
jgi:hypothetical protein